MAEYVHYTETAMDRVEDFNDFFFHHMVLFRLLRLTQIIVERAARKLGKLQQRLQGILLP